MIRRASDLVRFLLATFLVGGVRIYQVAVRPVLPPLCRFHPSCSEYMIEAVHKYGPLTGACKGVWRICRCNPWGRGGYDPP
jgi:putative membrane protein insertion efficiency factor